MIILHNLGTTNLYGHGSVLALSGLKKKVEQCIKEL
jgi:hypothetical protein